MTTCSISKANNKALQKQRLLSLTAPGQQQRQSGGGARWIRSQIFFFKYRYRNNRAELLGSIQVYRESYNAGGVMSCQ